MSKTVEQQWLLVGLEFTPLSKPFQNEGTGGEGAREIP